MNIVWSFASSIFWGLGRLDPIYCFWIYFFAPLPDLENNIPIFPVFQIPIFYNIDNSSYMWSLHDWAYEESLHGHSDPPSPPPPDKTMYMLLCIVYIMVGLTCTTTIIEIIRSWGLLWCWWWSPRPVTKQWSWWWPSYELRNDEDSSLAWCPSKRDWQTVQFWHLVIFKQF